MHIHVVKLMRVKMHEDEAGNPCGEAQRAGIDFLLQWWKWPDRFTMADIRGHMGVLTQQDDLLQDER